MLNIQIRHLICKYLKFLVYQSEWLYCNTPNWTYLSLSFSIIICIQIHQNSSIYIYIYTRRSNLRCLRQEDLNLSSLECPLIDLIDILIALCRRRSAQPAFCTGDAPLRKDPESFDWHQLMHPVCNVSVTTSTETILQYICSVVMKMNYRTFLNLWLYGNVKFTLNIKFKLLNRCIHIMCKIFYYQNLWSEYLLTQDLRW